MNASNTPLPKYIDGISGADNIAQMWRDHYSDIFNSVNQTIDVVYNVDESNDFGDVVVAIRGSRKGSEMSISTTE